MRANSTEHRRADPGERRSSRPGAVILVLIVSILVAIAVLLPDVRAAIGTAVAGLAPAPAPAQGVLEPGTGERPASLALPADFPTDLPRPSGRVWWSESTATGWNLQFESGEAAYTALLESLVADGYRVTEAPESPEFPGVRAATFVDGSYSGEVRFDPGFDGDDPTVGLVVDRVAPATSS